MTTVGSNGKQENTDKRENEGGGKEEKWLAWISTDNDLPKAQAGSYACAPSRHRDRASHLCNTPNDPPGVDLLTELVL